jgi:transposase
MVNVGVDLHKTQMTVCFMADDGAFFRKVYGTNNAGYLDFTTALCDLKEPRKEIRVAVETTGNVWNFMKRVENHVGEVKVVNTMRFKVITESTSKTDWRDSKTIADFLKIGMLPTVTLPDAESRMIAKYVKTRDRYVKLSTRLKNQLHAIFMEEGLELKAQDLTSDKRLETVKKHEGLNEEVRFLVEGLVDDLMTLKARIRKLESRMMEMIAEDENIKLIRTIPGTGLVSASAVRSIVGSIDRFDDPKKLASYAGLAPWVNNSNETVRHGHITKRGSTILRNAFVQMAMGMIRNWSTDDKDCSLPMHRWYEQMKKRAGNGKSKIALARKLSTIVWAILKNKEPFKYTLEKSLSQAG